MHGDEIVLRMGVGQAEGGVGIATAGDVRHAETVAHDGRVVFGRGDQRRSGVEPAETGFVRPGKSEERQDGEHDQSNYAAQDHAAPASTARH